MSPQMKALLAKQVEDSIAVVTREGGGFHWPALAGVLEGIATHLASDRVDPCDIYYAQTFLRRLEELRGGA